MTRRLRACRTMCLLLAASIALAGCGLIPDPTVKLVTDRAEMAAYVDRFNALQSDVRVEIDYRESPSQAVSDGVQGDVVVGEWLASPAVMDRFDSLGDLVKPGRIDPSWFYSGLITMGSRDNRSVLIPVSFSLPAIVFYRPTMQAELSSMFMPLDTLKSLARAFNADGKTGNLVAVGFSPLWNKDFLDAVAILFGARFRPGRNGLPGWDQEGLARVVELTRSWLSDVNESADADNVFTTRNFVQPWYRLLTGKKILFALDSFTDYYALPEEKRRDLDFRWLSQGGTIPVMGDVLFAGVLSSSRNKGGARAFLDWFCSPAVQRSLLDVNQSHRIGVFGITNGFSSLKSINEKDLAQKYPLLLGHIPTENLLAFPETLPDNWLRARDEVIRPWIAATAAGTEAQPLEKRLDEWLKGTQK